MPKGSTVMDACNARDVEIPHFCYHKHLSVPANCRMCLVEVEGAPKPVASCHWPAADGMVVNTKSETTINARKGTMEFLLINHPLDCPICDQGGECDLQDIALGYGSDRSRYQETKRAVEDKDIGPLIKTVMTRCIHCTRCIRFATEIAGVEEFGATGRGENMKVGTYVEAALESELCGNMIDLCPVGALTDKPYAYSARPWELVRTSSIDVMDATGSHILVDSRAGEVMRVVPEECPEINEEWISDTARFSWDGLKTNRLTAPLVKTGGSLKKASWPKAFEAIKEALHGVRRERIAGLAGDIHTAEELYAFSQFMHETIGTSNVDGRMDGVQVGNENRADYIMRTPIAEVEKADAILLIGCNPRFEAPIVNLRLRKAVNNHGAKLAYIGPEMDLRYPAAQLGETAEMLETIFNGEHAFSKVLKEAERPLIMLGTQALMRSDAESILNLSKSLAQKVGAEVEEWQGFNVLQRHAGRVAALDMGVLPGKSGMSAAEIYKALDGGKIDVLFIYGEADIDPVTLAEAKVTVFIGTHKSALAETADIVLPAAAYTEKSGWWVNTEGRVQEGRKSVAPPADAKDDWKIFRALSETLEKPLPFNTFTQLRELVAAKHIAYRKPGTVRPGKWVAAAAHGKLLKSPFEAPVTQFYLTNEILRASKVMAEQQAIVDEAHAPLRKAG